MKRAIIRGTGRYLPPRVVTNHDLCQWMDTSDEWIRQRTGIEERHWVDDDVIDGNTGTSDLGFEASKTALKRAGWSAEDIEMIIFATLSPDIFFPGTGCLLQKKLGLDSIPALDIRQQCTGFIHGLQIADAYIRSGIVNRILFVGSEIQSRVLDISTRGRDVSVLFGDGAGAVCIEGVETDKPVGILTSSLHARGKYADNLCIEVPAYRLNKLLTKEMLDQGRQHPKMDGKLVFNEAIHLLPDVANEVLKKAGLSKEDIDLYIPHQANMRINQIFQKTMGLPEEKVFHNIQRYGNTTAASIPIALDEALEMNIIGEKSTVLFIALGAGFTWGAAIYRFE